MTETENTETEPKPDYEQQFANRFSATDPAFQEYVRRPTDPPPIVEDWGGRRGNDRGRDHRYRGGGGGGRGRGWYGDRGWGGNHRREPDRRGYEGGHQSAHDRGYHPYNQRHYQSY